jgi:hypothetical protein
MTAVAGVLTVGVHASALPQRFGPEAPTGSRITVKPQAVVGLDKFSTLQQFSECVITRSPAKVDYYLRKSDNAESDPSLGQVVRYLPLELCLGSGGTVDANALQLTLNNQSLRGMLTEAAYKRANPAVPDASRAPVVRERTYFSPESERGRLKAQAYFSDCIVQKDPTGADALVRTHWGSKEEAIAARALAPVLGTCLLAGQTLSLLPQNVRQFVADGLWQRFEASKPISYEGRP